MMKLNIIWLFKKEGIFEIDWIFELYSKYEITEFIDSELNFNNVFNNTLIVAQNVQDQDRFIEYIRKFRLNNFKFQILHISDESLNHNIYYYNEFKDNVIRMIYCEKYTEEYKILTIPVGYKSGVRKINCDKKYLVNFIGQLKSDRSEMLDSYKNVSPKFIHLTKSWDDPNGIDTQTYSRIVSESDFTLCPSGWVSVDSFRINESLECGSIPVSVLYNGKNYFQNLYGDNPFIIGKNWKETIEIINTIDVDKKRIEVSDWWIEYKKNLKELLRIF